MSILNTGGSPKFAQNITLQPGAVTSNVVSTQTFTVKGLDPDGLVLINAPSIETGLFVVNAFVATKNVLTLQFWNTTGSTITPASQRFSIYQP